jgi:hypothetical protein
MERSSSSVAGLRTPSEVCRIIGFLYCFHQDSKKFKSAW